MYSKLWFKSCKVLGAIIKMWAALYNDRLSLLYLFVSCSCPFYLKKDVESYASRTSLIKHYIWYHKLNYLTNFLQMVVIFKNNMTS